MIKLFKAHNKEKSLKETRDKKGHIIYREIKIRITALLKTMQTKQSLLACPLASLTSVLINIVSTL